MVGSARRDARRSPPTASRSRRRPTRSSASSAASEGIAAIATATRRLPREACPNERPSAEALATRRARRLPGASGIMLATAESCTGGLIAAALTDIAGSSDVVDRGFVTYSNEAKMEMLGVAEATLDAHGAVSRETALAMAAARSTHSRAGIALCGHRHCRPGRRLGGKAGRLVWFGLAHDRAGRRSPSGGCSRTAAAPSSADAQSVRRRRCEMALAERSAGQAALARRRSRRRASRRRRRTCGRRGRTSTPISTPSMRLLNS